MTVSDKAFGKNREQIPNWAFRMMTFVMKTMDLFGYSKKNFARLNIQKGQVVVDYGCGPARYIHNISKAIGSEGKLYATDIHPIAIEKANNKIRKYKLNNTETIITMGYDCPLPDQTSDVLLALDMFHMIQNTNALLKEFYRISKPDGIVLIEDGHQAREETKAKILKSGFFEIESENKYHIICKLV